jgi:hypothetical protein
MRDVRSLLDEADPLAREPELSETDATRMRNAIVSAARQPYASSPFWSGTFAVAAVVVLTVIAGTLGGRNLSTRKVSNQVETVIAPAPGVERRQVQFATPGGTRIIWTLDPEFRLREVMP